MYLNTIDVVLVKPSEQIFKFNITKRVIESIFRLIDIANPIIPIHDRNVCVYFRYLPFYIHDNFLFFFLSLQNHIQLF